jgi:hypothetical protein
MFLSEKHGAIPKKIKLVLSRNLQNSEVFSLLVPDQMFLSFHCQKQKSLCIKAISHQY